MGPGGHRMGHGGSGHVSTRPLCTFLSIPLILAVRFFIICIYLHSVCVCVCRAQIIKLPPCSLRLVNLGGRRIPRERMRTGG